MLAICRRPKLGRLVLAVATLAASCVVAVALGPSAAAAARPAFDCATPTVFLSKDAPTQLYEATFDSGSVTLSPTGTASDSTYNATGFNPADNYLYAFPRSSAGNTLLQIDSTGAVSSIGAVSGLPDDAPFLVGTFDDDGRYWVMEQEGATVYGVDVESLTVDRSLPLTGDTWLPLDFAAIGGYLWGVGAEDGTVSVFRLDTATGHVDSFPAPAGMGPGIYGAAWTFGNGNLGVGLNAGTVYQLAISQPGGLAPTFTLVASYETEATDNNDAAACSPEPADLSITGSVATEVEPGQRFDWTMVVRNDGPGDSSGSALDATVPAEVADLATATPGCAVAGTSLHCDRGMLIAGESATLTLSATAPTTRGACFTLTATVLGNEEDPEPADNSTSSSTCVKAMAETTTTLVGAPNPSTYGQAVTVTATVSSAGGPATGRVDVITGGAGAIGCPDLVLDDNGTAACRLNGLAAGSHVVTVDYEGTESFLPSSGSVALTVERAILVVTASDATRYYSQPNPTFAYRIDGFVSGDTAATAMTGAPSLTTPATPASDAGNYPIEVDAGSLAATDYTFSFVPGTLTVLPAPTSVAAVPVVYVGPPGLTLLLRPLTVEARLTAFGQPVPGQTVSFSMGDSAEPTLLCTATTDSSGMARCAPGLIKALVLLLSGSYSAVFTGSGNYRPASTTTSAIVI